MNQRNIGENNVPSVKVHHNPGGKSNWSFGWGNQQPKPVDKNPTVTKYHNESHFEMNDNVDQIEDEQKRRQEERRKKEQEINSKLPTYDPKNANKTSIVFGDDKPDYRKKDQVQTSVKVRNPPGGRSNIQFG